MEEYKITIKLKFIAEPKTHTITYDCIKGLVLLYRNILKNNKIMYIPLSNIEWFEVNRDISNDYTPVTRTN